MTGRRREAGAVQNPTTGKWEFVVDVGQPVEHLPCPPECEIRHPMKVHVESKRIE